MSSDEPALSDYRWTRAFPLRWNDDDRFGHVNNTIHYQAMDSTVTAWLVTEGGVDLVGGGFIAVVVASSCRYVASAAFPDELVVGLRADRVGTTSITWGLGMFRASDGALVAHGDFTHVVVDTADRRPTPVPEELRARIEGALTPAP